MMHHPIRDRKIFRVDASLRPELHGIYHYCMPYRPLEPESISLAISGKRAKHIGWFYPAIEEKCAIASLILGIRLSILFTDIRAIDFQTVTHIGANILQRIDFNVLLLIMMTTNLVFKCNSANTIYQTVRDYPYPHIASQVSLMVN